jgi:type I restriction-modification system DNA methylase subunit
MCEDRNIEPVEKLRSVAQQQDNLAISELYAYLDHRYNTGLFNTRDDPYNGEYLLDSGVFLEIVEALYYPQAPYDFSVLDADFLGQIYEVFLVQRIVLDGAELKLDTKPAYRDRQVVTTPQSLVDDIVRKTIGGKIAELRSLDDLNLEAILKLKVLDIAVGSGRFLIRSLENLMDEALNCFIETNDTSNFYQLSEGNYKLKFSAKRELLEKCLFGIDIDYNAVEVAKFSLVIKLLEDESNSSIPVGNKILPNLDQNILWGNSIVGTDVSSELTQDEIERVHPFSFDLSGLPNEFDIIIGNPPYQKTEEMRSHSLKEFDYYKYTYGSAHRQFDKYYIFLEKGVQLLKVGGWLGYVVPNKWLTSESATKLRSILSDEVVESITDFGNELLFEDRSTYVCLLVLSKRDKEQFTYRYIDDYTKWIDTSADNGQTLPSEMLKLYSDKAWILPADDLEAGLLKKLILNSKPLSKIIEVFNGLQTSAEDVFPIPHWSDVGNDIIEFEQSGRQWRIEKAITKPYLMDSRNLVKSYLEIGQDALIIYPYIISEDNEPVFIKPHEMQANFPLAWEYLSHHKTRLSARSVSPSPEDGEFYRYGRHQALAKSFTQEKVLYSVNQLGHKYGIDRSGTGFASGGTAGEVALANPNDGYSLYFILGLLNQHAIEFYIRKRGSSFRGGYYSRGTAVISEVPVPVIDFENGQQKELHGIITELVKNRIVTENTLISATGREHAMLVQQKDNLDQNIAEHFNKLWNLSTAEKTVRLRGSS